MSGELGPKEINLDLIRNRGLDKIKDRKSVLNKSPLSAGVIAEFFDLDKEEILEKNDKNILTSKNPEVNYVLAEIESYRIGAKRLRSKRVDMYGKNTGKNELPLIIGGEGMLAQSELMDALAERKLDHLTKQHPSPAVFPKK